MSPPQSTMILPGKLLLLFFFWSNGNLYYSTELPHLKSSRLFLDLSFNKLTGSVHVELSLLENLGGIHLDRNKLSGPIPDWIFMWNAPDINLSHNKLTGGIPESLGVITTTRGSISRVTCFRAIYRSYSGQTRLSRLLTFHGTCLGLVWVMWFFRRAWRRWISIIIGYSEVFRWSWRHWNFSSWMWPIIGCVGRFRWVRKLQSFDATPYFHNRFLCRAPLTAC